VTTLFRPSASDSGESRNSVPALFRSFFSIRPSSRTLATRSWLLFLFFAAPVAIVLGLLEPRWGIASASAMATIVLVAWRPGIFLLIFMVFYSLSQASLSSYGAGITAKLNLNQLLVPLAIGLLTVRALLDAAVSKRSLSLHWAIAAHVPFVVWVCTTVLWAPSGNAHAAAGRVVTCLAAWYVAYCLGASERGHFWVYLTIAAVSIIAAYSAGFERFVGDIGFRKIGASALRSGGSFGAPVIAATVAFAGLPVFIHYVRMRSHRGLQAIGAMGLVGIAVAIAATLTRTVLLGLLVFSLLYVYFNYGGSDTKRFTTRWKTFIVVGTLVVLVGFATLVFVPSDVLSDRTRDFASGSGRFSLDEDSGSGRARIWKYLLILERRSSASEIVFGHGLKSVIPDLYQVIRIPNNAHNSFLQVLYDTGLLGLSAYLFAIWATFTQTRRRNHDSPTLRSERLIWHAYFLSFLVSTVFFNAYVYAVGGRLLLFLGIGALMGRTRARRLQNSR